MSEKNKKEISDEEIEKFLKEQDEKEITQTDKIDDSVEEFMKEMGFITQIINKNISEANVCFECGNALYNEHQKERNLFLVELKQEKKGVMVIAGLCKLCYEKLKLKQGEKNE